MKKFTADDLSRILCAVDENIMFAALKQRLAECPTTTETVKGYLVIIVLVLQFAVSFIPFGSLVLRLLKLIINIIERVLKLI